MKGQSAVYMPYEFHLDLFCRLCLPSVCYTSGGCNHKWWFEFIWLLDGLMCTFCQTKRHHWFYVISWCTYTDNHCNHMLQYTILFTNILIISTHTRAHAHTHTHTHFFYFKMAIHYTLATQKMGRVAQSVERLNHGLDGPGLNPGGDKIFRPSRPALGPTQPPVHGVPGLSRG